MKNKLILTFASLMVLSFAVLAGNATTKTVDVKIEGMTCSGCVNMVKTALEQVDGVTEANVMLATNTATVTFDDNKVNETDITNAVKTSGYKAVYVADKCCDGKNDCCEKSDTEKEACCTEK